MINELKADQMASTSLAYVGDAVFSLFVREKAARSSLSKSGGLARICDKLVSAPTQAKMYDFIKDKLSEEEYTVMRRCRNCHVISRAKNAGINDYKKATGFEGLIGWLYLSGIKERLIEIMTVCVEEQTQNEQSGRDSYSKS